MKKFLNIISFLFLILIPIQPILAKDIPEEKNQLIDKLLELNGVTFLEEANMKMVISSINHDMDYFIDEVSLDANIPKDQKEKVKKESFERISGMFKGLYPKKINSQEIYKSTYLEMYDKHFSKNELQSIMTFFNSPIGKKYLETMPKIDADAIKKISEKIDPKITELVNQLIEEEKNFLKKIYPKR